MRRNRFWGTCWRTLVRALRLLGGTVSDFVFVCWSFWYQEDGFFEQICFWKTRLPGIRKTSKQTKQNAWTNTLESFNYTTTTWLRNQGLTRFYNSAPKQHRLLVYRFGRLRGHVWEIVWRFGDVLGTLLEHAWALVGLLGDVFTVVRTTCGGNNPIM